MRLDPRLTLWLVIIQTGLVHVLTYLSRPSITYAAMDAGLSAGVLGVIGGAYAAIALVIAIPVGRWNDRIGAWPLFVIGSAVMLGAVIALGFAPVSAWTLAGIAGLVGAGHLACTVSAQSAVADASPGRLDTAFGHLTLIASLGQALGPLALGLAPDAAARQGFSREDLTLVCVGVALLLLTLLNRLPFHHGGGEAEPQGSLSGIVRIPGLLTAVVASALILAAVDLTVIYLPLLGEERGLSAAAVGTLLAIRGVASMVSRFGLGRIVASIGRSRFMVISVVVSSLTLLATAMPMPYAALAVVMAVMGLGLGVGQPLTMAWVSTVAPARDRGLALALRLTGNRIGQLTLPAAVGALTPIWGAGVVFIVTGLAVGSLALVFRRGGLESEA
ncbi:MFS transporter [Actinomycetota bacterium]